MSIPLVTSQLGCGFVSVLVAEQSATIYYSETTNLDVSDYKEEDALEFLRRKNKMV